MIRRAGAVACTIVAVLAVASPATAEPEPHVGNPKAACLGIAASEHGANDPAGTWAADVAGLRAFLRPYGYTLGDVFSRWAQVDAATHLDCEEALRGLDLDAPH